MAFGVTISDRISFGNFKGVFVNITDAQSTGSNFKIGSTTWMVKATNNSDTADTFKEAIRGHSSPSTRNGITFTPVTSNDDGHAFILYR